MGFDIQTTGENMNLYHISQSENNGYDTFSDAVVAAPDPETARDMDPCNGLPVDWREQYGRGRYASWATARENVTVQCIGTAIASVQQGVVCASFHAG